MANLPAGFIPDAPTTGLPAGFVPDAPEAEPETYTPLETIGRNAVNVFGAGPALSGVFQHLVNGRDYAEARDETKRHLDEANEQNPIAHRIGQVASLVPETLIGGAAGRVVGLGAKAVGLTDALSPVMQKLGAVGTDVVKGALGGAGYGAASGAGTAASEGRDILPAAAEGAGSGAVLGGAIGGVAGKIGESFGGSEAAQRESIVRGASERALPKKQSALAGLIDESAEDGTTSALKKTDVTPAKVIDDNLQILKGFRSGDYQTVADSAQAVTDKVSALERPKAGYYKTVDQALDGGFNARAPIDALENKAATETEAPWRRVLQDRASALKSQWSSITTDEAKKYLTATRVTGDQTARDALEGLAEKLPAGEQWTKADFLDHLAGGERGSAAKNWADMDPELRKAVESLPFKFDGSLKIPSQDLRKVLTMSQDEAESALGTLNATKNARLAALTQDVLGTTMSRTLDQAVNKGLTPEVVKAVQGIRDINMQQSVLLRINEAAAKKIEKLQLGKPTLGGIAGHGIANMLGGYELLGAGKHLLHGDIGSAATDAAAAIAAKLAPKAIVGAKNATVDAMAAVQRAAAAGNPRAIGLIKAMSAARKLGTAGAGSVGSAANSTLGQQDE